THHSSQQHTFKKRQASHRLPLPDNFSISRAVREWAQKHGFEPLLEAHLEHFKDYCRAKGALYDDFDAAFRNCIRNDWGKVRASQATIKAAKLVDERCSYLPDGMNRCDRVGRIAWGEGCMICQECNELALERQLPKRDGHAEHVRNLVGNLSAKLNRR